MQERTSETGGFVNGTKTSAPLHGNKLVGVYFVVIITADRYANRGVPPTSCGRCNGKHYRWTTSTCDCTGRHGAEFLRNYVDDVSFPRGGTSRSQRVVSVDGIRRGNEWKKLQWRPLEDVTFLDKIPQNSTMNFFILLWHHPAQF